MSSLIAIFRFDSKRSGAISAWILFLFSFVIKMTYLVYQLWFSHSWKISVDSQYYFDIAQEYLNHGMGNAYSVNPAMGLIMVGPIEPLYLMAISTFISAHWEAVFVVNALLASLIGVFVFKIARLMSLDRLGWYCGLYLGIYKFFIGNGFFLSAGKDMLMTLCMVVILFYLTTWILKKKGLMQIILMLSIAIHLDERFLVVVLLTGSVFLFHSFFSIGAWKSLTVLILGVLVMCTPWLVRNYYAHGRIVFLSPRISQYIDPLLNQKTDIDILKGESDAKSFTEAELDSIAAGKMLTKTYVYSGRTPETMEIPLELMEEVKNGNRPHAFSYSEQVQHAARDYFFPIFWKREWSNLGYTLLLPQKKSVWVSTILEYLWVLPFSILGLYFLFKDYSNNGLSWIWLGILFLYAGINIFFMPFIDNRYRWPIDPLLIFLAFFAIERVWKKVNKTSV